MKICDEKFKNFLKPPDALPEQCLRRLYGHRLNGLKLNSEWTTQGGRVTYTALNVGLGTAGLPTGSAEFSALCFYRCVSIMILYVSFKVNCIRL